MKKAFLTVVFMLVMSGVALAGSAERMDFIRTDADFAKRCRYFFNKAAISVMSEDATTELHASRQKLAAKVLRGQLSMDAMATGVVTNSTIGTNIDALRAITDNDIEFVVNSIYNAYAKAYRYR